MPLCAVERTFLPERLGRPLGDEGEELRQTVGARNADDGVTWVHSYVIPRVYANTF